MDVNNRRKRLVARLLFAGYLAVLCYLLFFSEAMGRTENAAFRFNLVPFREIMRYIRYASSFAPSLVIVNLIGNVVAFMPFGCILPHIANRRIGVFSTTIHAFFFSLLVECIQLLLRVGSFDVDDIILNTLGGLLGYLLGSLLNRRQGGTL